MSYPLPAVGHTAVAGHGHTAVAALRHMAVAARGHTAVAAHGHMAVAAHGRTAVAAHVHTACVSQHAPPPARHLVVDVQAVDHVVLLYYKLVLEKDNVVYRLHMHELVQLGVRAVLAPIREEDVLLHPHEGDEDAGRPRAGLVTHGNGPVQPAAQAQLV